MENKLINLINSKVYAPIDTFLLDREKFKSGIVFSHNTGSSQNFNLFKALSEIIYCTPDFSASPVQFLDAHFKKPKNSLTVFPDECISLVVFQKQKYKNPKICILKKEFFPGKFEDLIYLKNNPLISFKKAFIDIEIHIKLIKCSELEVIAANHTDLIIDKIFNKNEELKSYLAINTESDSFSDYEEYTKGYLTIQNGKVIEHLNDIYLSITFYSEYLDKDGYVSKANFKTLVQQVKERYSLFDDEIIPLEKIISFAKKSIF